MAQPEKGAPVAPARQWFVTRLLLLAASSLSACGQTDTGSGQAVGSATDISALDPAPEAVAALDLVVDGLSRPTYLTHSGDDRLFISEQEGQVQVVASGMISAPFLDIRDRVGSGGNEQGLLSLAFDPTAADRLYLYYTNREGDVVVSAFRHDGRSADPASETILLTVAQPYSNHNGGQLQFGPDGYLYVGLGDGGAAGDPENRAQDLGTLLGKLLRINVGGEPPYEVPADNPFAETAGARPEVFAYGLRNPWRFSFDESAGRLFVADVGQNAWEELSIVAAGSAGLNYGWKRLEGTACFAPEDCDPAGTVLPEIVYGHSQDRCSITGGYAYRGAAKPDAAGHYFFADYCSGTIWRAVPERDAWAVRVAAETDLQITSFGRDAAGEIYVLARDGGVYRLLP
jgi:glucose/arabinose dehydrogenase